MIPESRAWQSIHARARRAIGWAFRVAAARATLRALAKMDRRELADIGLSVSDLRDASALALDRDPGELLARRARERRSDAFGAGLSGRDDRPEQDRRDRTGRNGPPPRRPDALRRASLVRSG
jgi:uncharacterized protein YjiS (DUF1127 family)